jgi:hypothetical protein
MWMVIAVPTVLMVEKNGAGEPTYPRLADVETKLQQATAAGWQLQFVVSVADYVIHYLSK